MKQKIGNFFVALGSFLVGWAATMQAKAANLFVPENISPAYGSPGTFRTETWWEQLFGRYLWWTVIIGAAIVAGIVILIVMLAKRSRKKKQINQAFPRPPKI